MGLLDVLKKGAGVALNPFGQKQKDPFSVGNANDKNYNAFMNTDYSKFKDAQGNYTPSSLIGTNVPGNVPTAATGNLPNAPNLPLPTPTQPAPDTSGLGLPNPDFSALTPTASPPPVTPAQPKPNTPTIAPPSAFTASQFPGLFNDGTGGLTYSKNTDENKQYGYWGADTYNNTPAITPPSGPGGPSSYAQAFFNGQPVTTGPKARF